MEFRLLNNTVIGYQDEKTGEWLYKANPQAPFKKDGNLKKVYHDLPRFPAIVQYEDKELKDFEQSLAESVKDISIKLQSFSK